MRDSNDPEVQRVAAAVWADAGDNDWLHELDLSDEAMLMIVAAVLDHLQPRVES